MLRLSSVTRAGSLRVSLDFLMCELGRMTVPAAVGGERELVPVDSAAQGPARRDRPLWRPLVISWEIEVGFRVTSIWPIFLHRQGKPS